MKIIKLLPEEIEVGMEVFIYGHSDIDFEKPGLVTRLYSRPLDLGFDVAYDDAGRDFTITDGSLRNSLVAVFTKAANTTAASWSDKHYSFEYTISLQDVDRGSIRVDPYFVSKQWQLGKKDDTGTIFHILKTIARFGDKNSKEREIKALYAQVKRLAELEFVDLD